MVPCVLTPMSAWLLRSRFQSTSRQWVSDWHSGTVTSRVPYLRLRLPQSLVRGWKTAYMDKDYIPRFLYIYQHSLGSFRAPMLTGINAAQDKQWDSRDTQATGNPLHLSLSDWTATKIWNRKFCLGGSCKKIGKNDLHILKQKLTCLYVTMASRRKTVGDVEARLRKPSISPFDVF